jgi:AraC-like DNA-binding protein
MTSHDLQPCAAPPLGAASQANEHVYVLGYHGFVHTVPDAPNAWTTRPAAVLLLSAEHRAFELELEDGTVLVGSAMAVAPLVTRRLHAPQTQLLSFNMQPVHRRYPEFRGLTRPGAMTLSRQAYLGLEDELQQMCRGEADLKCATRVFREAMQLTCEQLPPTHPPDPRILSLVSTLHANPSASVDALGEQIGRSANWVSRQFSAAMGISLRDYQAWLKQRRFFDTFFTERSLTDVAFASGFADSSQFSRTFQRWYGRSPSAGRNPRNVHVVVPCQSGAAGTPASRQPGDDFDVL